MDSLIQFFDLQHIYEENLIYTLVDTRQQAN